MSGFVPPPYPYERLGRARRLAEAHEGGIVDLSVGTPCDPPPPAVVAALASSGAERGYPASIGSKAFREAAKAWLNRTLSADVPAEAVLACVGTKEMVVSLPHILRLRSPGRDTVLYPELSYPSYSMGAELAGCRALPVPIRDGAPDLTAIAEADAARALCLWVNSPSNPTGALDDLGAAAAWGRAQDVPVVSDECYLAFTWDGPGRSILQHGIEGVLALHSLSKRSNLAGLRSGFCAGDPALIHYLGEVRKHAGLMVPGPVQAASVVALEDEDHVAAQRGRYWERLECFATVLQALGLSVSLPGGGFYLWAEVPDATAWEWTDNLAEMGGVLVSPGDLYGPAGSRHLRVAMVAPMDRLELVAQRLSGAV